MSEGQTWREVTGEANLKRCVLPWLENDSGYGRLSGAFTVHVQRHGSRSLPCRTSSTFPRLLLCYLFSLAPLLSFLAILAVLTVLLLVSVLLLFGRLFPPSFPIVLVPGIVGATPHNNTHSTLILNLNGQVHRSMAASLPMAGNQRISQKNQDSRPVIRTSSASKPGAAVVAAQRGLRAHKIRKTSPRSDPKHLNHQSRTVTTSTP